MIIIIPIPLYFKLLFNYYFLILGDSILRDDGDCRIRLLLHYYYNIILLLLLPPTSHCLDYTIVIILLSYYYHICTLVRTITIGCPVASIVCGTRCLHTTEIRIFVSVADHC